MPRRKSAKQNYEALAEDTVHVATTDVAEPKKAKGHRSKASVDSTADELAEAGADAPRSASVRTPRAKRAAKKDLDNGLKGARKAVDDISDTFGSALSTAASPWPLPGALSPAVDTGGAMRVVVVSAIASTAILSVLDLVVDWFATLQSQTWISKPSYLGATPAPGIWSPFAAAVLLILKLTVSWGSLGNLFALNVLSYGPFVYLFTSFYDVPLRSALASAAIKCSADVVPILAWRWLWNEDEEDYLVEARGDHEMRASNGGAHPAAAAGRDPATAAYSSVFAGALYGFTFVQACRLFLPATFVVHFFGIATVEPARTHSFDRSSAITLHDVFLVLFQSVSVAVLSLVCGTAARMFIFGDNATRTRNTVVDRKAGALRTAALALVTGLDIFARCLLGIQGADAVGSAAFASVSAVAIMLVGAGLSYAELWA